MIGDAVKLPTGRVRRLGAQVCGRAALLAAVACLGASPGRAEDWPVYRHDRLRTAVTAEKLPLPLIHLWRFRARVAQSAPPVQTSTVDREAPNALYNGRHTWAAQATPDESRWALPITSASDALFFTSHDGRIVCLSAQTGEVRWQFLTAAAVTQAANYYDGRVYAGSDDGHVYCLAADTGKLIWKYKAAPADRWIISYDRMSSLWPVRTDVMVDVGVAYFVAGIFPHDGVYTHAVRADTGEPVWRKGGVPYGGAGVSGYPILTKDMYHCPVDLKGFNRWPMFRRGDGVYDWTAADPERATVHFGGGDGRETHELGVFKDGSQYLGSWARKRTPDGKETQLWSVNVDRWYDPSKIILAGDTLFYLADDKAIWGAPRTQAGDGGAVIARDITTGKELWSFPFVERPHHILVANGRLFVSSRNGTIDCFASQGEPAKAPISEAVNPNPFAESKHIERSQAGAEQIVKAAGVGKGYAVVLDCVDGALAWQLAARKCLYVVAVFADAEQAQSAREKFAGADLHGSRVAVWHGQPGARLPVPAQTADLVTSEGTLYGGALPTALDEVTRMLKPIRGTALFLAWGRKQAPESWSTAFRLLDEKQAKAWTPTGGSAPVPATPSWTQFAQDNHWCARLVRPPLEGSGGWAASRGGPDKTNNSHDKALKGPLGVVWYGGPSVRRGNYAPPLLTGGVLLCAIDDHHLVAHDQYNGRLLWQFAAEGIGGSVLQNGVAGGNHLYTIHGGRCLRFQLYEGGQPEVIAEPLGGGQWTAVAVSRDGKTVWGAAQKRDAKNQAVWAGIFALDAQTNRPLWKSGGPDAIAAAQAAGQTTVKVWQSWNAIADGRMYIIGPITDPTRQQAIDETRAYLAQHYPDQVAGFDNDGSQRRDEGLPTN